jgi:hypothetical protein
MGTGRPVQGRRGVHTAAARTADVCASRQQRLKPAHEGHSKRPTIRRIIWPEFGEDLMPSRRAVIIASVAFIGVAFFLLGAHQAAFLTCEDFSISGNSEPRVADPRLHNQHPLRGPEGAVANQGRAIEDALRDCQVS